MPAACAPLKSTFDTLATDGESTASVNDPWRPGFFFSRYFESPLLVRYVCGVWLTLSHVTDGGVIAKPVAAHPSAELVTSDATSGMPVAAPAASAQLVMSVMSFSSNAAVPTSAKSSPHALMVALRASLGFSFESMK